MCRRAGFAIVAPIMVIGMVLGARSGAQEVSSQAGAPESRVTISGRVLDPMGASVPGATVQAVDGLAKVWFETRTDREGAYLLEVDSQRTYSLVARAEGFEAVTTELRLMRDSITGWDLAFQSLARVGGTVTVTAQYIVEPTVDRRDSQIFTKTLFTRDDQVFQTLGAGLNLGQHAGGGKSLEVRRFGFNLDHGGSGGGIRVIRDDTVINEIDGGHAHGYLGALKGLTPELVEEVNLVNGPFDAQYGDFSSLGVVTIRTRAEMPDELTGRMQFGQFNTRRLFTSYSPKWKDSSALIGLESSYSDGPFQRKLEYLRNNLTAVYSRRLGPAESLTLRGWAGTNSSYSPGQIPLDLVEAGQLDKFGFIDPTEGNKERSGSLSASWNKQLADGSTLHADATLNRTLFNLYSNFTYFLDDPVNGDAVTQRASRLQQQANFQYQRPHSLGSRISANFTGGANLIANQAYLTLEGRQGRTFTDLRTAARVSIANPGFYGHEALLLLNGRLTMDLGIRLDTFRGAIRDEMVSNAPRLTRFTSFWQPKAGVAFTPFLGVPLTFHANYGRAVTSVGARTLLTDPRNPLGSTTDFYQLGTSHNRGRYSLATSFFLIDRSNELVYVADSGQTEVSGASRSYGFEVKSSVDITRWLSWNGSISRVSNAFFRGTSPREYIQRAPHFTGYSALTISGWRNWSGSLRARSINSYILTGDGSVLGPGYTVLDFSAARTINRWVELNFAMDNLFNRTYYETLALYESRVTPGADAVERIHGTPGYPRTVMVGVTIRFGQR